MRRKETVLGVGEGEDLEDLRMEGRGEADGGLGGRPRFGGWAGVELGGRQAGLRRWTETASVRSPYWRRKEEGERRRTRKGPE